MQTEPPDSRDHDTQLLFYITVLHNMQDDDYLEIGLRNGWRKQVDAVTYSMSGDELLHLSSPL